MKERKQNLTKFYDNEHKKFHHTRKKIRPEMIFIRKEIETEKKQKIKILELWCGDGRLLSYLKKHTEKKINYTGIDISQNLLNIARKNHSWSKFIHGDMVDKLASLKNPEYDYIIAMASFQHLITKQERKKVIEEMYRCLKYNGKCILINWSFSRWFIKKFKKQIIRAIINPYQKRRNDLLIPRKSNKKTYMRFYHIFTLKEIKNIIKKSSFSIKRAVYIDKAWRTTKERQNARNTMIIAQKSITKKHISRT